MATIPPATEAATTTPEAEAVAGGRPPRCPRRWARLLAEAGLLLLAFLAIRAFQQRGVPTGEAPPIEARLVDGAPFSLGELRGEAVAVHFWASWCGVCRAMKGNVVSASGRRPGRVVTVASRSGDPLALRAFLRENGLLGEGGDPIVPVIPDPEGRIAAAYGVRAFPTTFFLDGEGNIATVEVGYTTTLGLRARLFWAGL